MVSTYLKSGAVMLALLIATAPIHAKTQKLSCQPAIKMQKVQKSLKAEQPVNKCEVWQPMAKALREEVTKHNLTVNLETEGNFATPLSVGLHAKDYSEFPFVQDGAVTTQVPEGDLVIVADFEERDEHYMTISKAMVIREVYIDSDMTLSLSPSEATCTVPVGCVNPAGEKITLNELIGWDPEDMRPIIEPGNVDYLALYTVLKHKDFGVIRAIGSSTNYQSTNPDMGPINDPYEDNKIHVSPLSDKITLARIAVATDDEGYFLTSSKPINGISESCEEEYCEFDLSYTIEAQPTKLSETSEDVTEAPKTLATFVPYYTDGTKFFMGDSMTSMGDKIRIAGSELAKDFMYMTIAPSIVDLKKYYYDEEGEKTGYGYYAITMPTMKVDKDGIEYYSYSPLAELASESDLEYNEIVPSNEWYDFLSNETSSGFGTTQPALLCTWTKKSDYVMDEETFTWNIVYELTPALAACGRLGENVSSAFYPDSSIEWGFKEDGKDVNDSWFTNPEEREKFDLVKLRSNVDGVIEVDGISGSTHFVSEWDETKEDAFPPTLTMLQTRKNNGFITDRFETSDEGCIILSGDDFNGEWNGSQMKFSHSPATVNVMYRPTGTEEDWIEMSIENLNSDEFIGFGSHYKIGLNQVNALSPTGWYDLRISLKDPAGNYQEQDISPVFKIGSLSGIERINSNEINTPVKIYDINGYARSEISKGVNICVMADGKVYKVVR